jgi:hypothetical protein
MPASLAVLASVEVDYVTLPGWTEPLAACKACAFASLLLPLPGFFSLGAPDVRGTPQERSGLREVVSFAANAAILFMAALLVLFEHPHLHLFVSASKTSSKSQFSKCHYSPAASPPPLLSPYKQIGLISCFETSRLQVCGCWPRSPRNRSAFLIFFFLQYKALSMNLVLFALFCCSHAMVLNLYLPTEAAGHFQLDTAATLHAHTGATKIKLSTAAALAL